MSSGTPPFRKRRPGPREILAPADPRIVRLIAEWRRLGFGVKTVREPAEVADGSVGVVAALAGVADTGSVVLDAGSFERLAATALVDTSVIALDPRDVVADLAAAAPVMDGAVAAGSPLVRLVTGPSRTADIEQSLTVGAHGPKEVHVFLMPLAHAG